MRKGIAIISCVVLLLIVGSVLFKKYSGHDDSNIFKESALPISPNDLSETTSKPSLEEIKNPEEDLVPNIVPNHVDNSLMESKPVTSSDQNTSLSKKQLKRINMHGKEARESHQNVFDLQERSEWSGEYEETLSSTFLPMLEKYQMFDDSLDIECKESICKAIIFHETFRSNLASFVRDFAAKRRDSKAPLSGIFGGHHGSVIDGSPGFVIFLFTHDHDHEKYEQYYLREIAK